MNKKMSNTLIKLFILDSQFHLPTQYGLYRLQVMFLYKIVFNNACIEFHF